MEAIKLQQVDRTKERNCPLMRRPLVYSFRGTFQSMNGLQTSLTFLCLVDLVSNPKQNYI